MPHGFPYHGTSRQASLPRPKPQTGEQGDRGMHGLFTGRVVRWNDDDGTVDVYLERGSFLKRVPISKRAAGPDRASDDPIPARTVVGVQFMYGLKVEPLVTDVIERVGDGMNPPRPKTRMAFRRLWRSGTHFLVQDGGAAELVLADGTYLAIGPDTTPSEDHTGQAQEGDQGDPFQPAPSVPHPKPAPYKLTIQLADGSKLQVASGKVTVFSAAEMELHATGPASVKSDVKLDVNAPVIALNGGTRPVARAGDTVDVGGFGPMAGVISPLTAGNHTVLA